MPGTRSRLASKQDEICQHCNKATGQNWLLCEWCHKWTHSDCMGYTKDEFKLLEKSRNIVFICDPCLPSAKGNMASNAISRELTENVSELKRTVESVKEAVIELGSTAPDTSAQPTNFEAKYSSITKSSIDYALELRFSGIPELKKPNINRYDIFAHDEKLLLDAVSNLGIRADEIASFYRLGKFKPDQVRPRQILAKFRSRYVADKLLARASMLNLYEPKFNGNHYKVFISKSPKKRTSEGAAAT